MTRLMADSTNPFDIPAGQFPIVAGYTDGLYAWSGAGWKYHEASVHFRLCCTSIDLTAHCADIEPGCLSAAQGAEFVFQKVSRGEVAYLYYSESRTNEIHAALGARGLDPGHAYGGWVARWDNRAVLDVAGYIKQYANPTLTGAHYDLSVAADYLPGVDSLPPPPPVSGPGAGVQNWSGLQVKVDVDIPAFGAELGVLASGLVGLG